jgi:hypothetical protein
VKFIVCLQTPADSILKGAYDEDLLVENFGIELFHQPWSDIWFPTDAQFIEVDKIVERCRVQGMTFVHCTHGQDRTGVWGALRRVKRQNKSPDEAITEMDKIGFHNFPYFWWKPLLREAMQRIQFT